MLRNNRDRLGQSGVVVLALFFTAPAAMAGAAGTAYFSFEGDFNTVGDAVDFNVGLTRSVSSLDDLRFVTYANAGGTNAAGDSIGSGGIDSYLELFDSLNNSRGYNDDHGSLDSLVSWSTVQSSGTPLNPNPLASGDYRLNLHEFGDNQTGAFAVDLIGPADGIAFAGLTTTGTTTIDSLKFGTTGGAGSAFYQHTNASGNLNIQDQFSIAHTGEALFNLFGSTISVTGLTTLNAGGTLNLAGGTLNANGGMTVNGGTLSHSSGGLSFGPGATFSATNNAQVTYTGNKTVNNSQFYDINGGSDVSLTGYLDVGSGNNGNLIVDGSGTTLTIGDTSYWGYSGGNAEVTFRNSAKGNINASLLHIAVGSVSNTTGVVRVESGADLDLSGLTIAYQGPTGGSGSLTVTGGGSTVNQKHGSDLTIGHSTNGTATLTVENNATFNASSTGTLNVNATGSLNVNTGGLFSVTPPNAAQFQDGLPGNTITSSGTLQLTGGTLRLNGGLGGVSGSGGSARPGGLGGQLNLNGGTLTLDGASVLTVRGGTGGGGGSGIVNGGKGGNGGQVLINNASVVVNDTSTLTLAGGNGGFPINFGVGGDGGTGGTLTLSAGSLTVNGGLVTTAGGVTTSGVLGTAGVDGAHGTINLNGGTFTLNGGEVFTGSYTRTAGTFNHNNGKLTVAGGAYNNNLSFLTINGPSAADLPTLVLDEGATAPGLTGSVIVGQSNRGRLDVVGSSSINAGNFFVVGQTGFSDGTLEVNSGGTVSAVNRFVIGDGGTGVATIGAGGTLTASNDLDLAAIGTGTLNVDGTGALVNANAQLYVGGYFAANGGTGTLNIKNAGVVNVAGLMHTYDGGTTNITTGGKLNANGNVNIDGGTLTADNAANFNLAAGKTLTASNAGQIDFTAGFNSYNIDEGTTFNINTGADFLLNSLRVGDGSAGTLIVDGAGSTLGSVGGVWGDNGGFATGTIRNGANASGGSNTILKNGSLTVDGAGTTFTQGSFGLLSVGSNSGGVFDLNVRNGGAFTTGQDYTEVIKDGTINVESGATFTVKGQFRIYEDGEVDVAGGILIANQPTTLFNNSTLNLSSGTLDAATIDNTQGGSFNFYGGTLHVDFFDGYLDQQGGVLAPGNSPGITEITNGYFNNGGTIQIELDGLTAGAEFDQVQVTGNAHLGAGSVLDVVFPNAFTYTQGASLVILQADSYTGSFNSVNFAANPGATFGVVYGSTTVTLLAGLPGDLNNDGFVGIADLNIVLGNWNNDVTAGVWFNGDPSGDGFVGITDLNVVLGNWNVGTPPSGGSTQVPEPATAALLALGGVCVSRRRS